MSEEKKMLDESEEIEEKAKQYINENEKYWEKDSDPNWASPNKVGLSELSEKYEVLNIFKNLVYLFMIIYTLYIAYILFQLYDAYNAMKSYGGEATLLSNGFIQLVLGYLIGIFFLFCLTKMINFLFDLEKQKSDR
tara:strand:- start:67 stop:474 length:408 start_codon:yes stop_codon:yes gene_type:complete